MINEDTGITWDEYLEIFKKQEWEKEILIHNALMSGDEQRAREIIDIECGNLLHQQQRMLLIFAQDFKDPFILYDLIISVYINDGYYFPKKLIQIAKRLSKQIPESQRLKGLPEGDVITVWRGTDCQALRTDISWTTDKKTAVWFANRHRKNEGCGNVWEATIQRDKIIAYTNERGEKEIIQHINVKNVHLLDIGPEEWKRCLEEREKEVTSKTEY